MKIIAALIVYFEVKVHLRAPKKLMIGMAVNKQKINNE